MAAAGPHRRPPRAIVKPFIATQPQVDATDFYMFRSYEPGRDGYVTLVANYVPLQNRTAGRTTSSSIRTPSTRST